MKIRKKTLVPTVFVPIFGIRIQKCILYNRVSKILFSFLVSDSESPRGPDLDNAVTFIYYSVVKEQRIEIFCISRWRNLSTHYRNQSSEGISCIKSSKIRLSDVNSCIQCGNFMTLLKYYNMKKQFYELKYSN